MAGYRSTAKAWEMIALDFMVPVIFAAAIAYCLWTGVIPVRGWTISRTTDPATYWFTLGFFAICIVGILGEIIFPNWGFSVLRAAGFAK
jgi:hypothetical protein